MILENVQIGCLGWYYNERCYALPRILLKTERFPPHFPASQVGCLLTSVSSVFFGNYPWIESPASPKITEPAHND